MFLHVIMYCHFLLTQHTAELPQNFQVKNKWKTHAVCYPNFCSNFVWETTDMSWQTVRRILKERPGFRSQITDLLCTCVPVYPASILRREAICIVLLKLRNVITIDAPVTSLRFSWGSSFTILILSASEPTVELRLCRPSSRERTKPVELPLHIPPTPLP